MDRTMLLRVQSIKPNELCNVPGLKEPAKRHPAAFAAGPAPAAISAPSSARTELPKRFTLRRVRVRRKVRPAVCSLRGLIRYRAPIPPKRSTPDIKPGDC